MAIEKGKHTISEVAQAGNTFVPSQLPTADGGIVKALVSVSRGVYYKETAPTSLTEAEKQRQSGARRLRALSSVIVRRWFSASFLQIATARRRFGLRLEGISLRVCWTFSYYWHMLLIRFQGSIVPKLGWWTSEEVRKIKDFEFEWWCCTSSTHVH